MATNSSVSAPSDGVTGVNNNSTTSETVTTTVGSQFSFPSFPGFPGFYPPFFLFPGVTLATPVGVSMPAVSSSFGGIQPTRLFATPEGQEQ